MADWDKNRPKDVLTRGFAKNLRLRPLLKCQRLFNLILDSTLLQKQLGIGHIVNSVI